MNEIKFWEGGWTPKGTIKVPPDYKRLPAGSPFATRLAKKLTWEMGRPVFVEMKHSKKGGYSRAIACWVPTGIIPEVRRAEQETEQRRSANREVSQKTRSRRHERELVRLTARLAELFPGMPENERETVVHYAFEVGSKRVGRTTKLEEDRRLELAVIAHARHQHTDYDERLAMGEDRDDLREELGSYVRMIVDMWKKRPVAA
jgi:hypothetical protein